MTEHRSVYERDQLYPQLTPRELFAARELKHAILTRVRASKAIDEVLAKDDLVPDPLIAAYIEAMDREEQCRTALLVALEHWARNAVTAELLSADPEVAAEEPHLLAALREVARGERRE